MTVRTITDDRGNRVSWHGDDPVPPVAIEFMGAGAAVAIGAGCEAATARLRLGDGATVAIGDRCRLACLDLYAAGASTIRIGDDVSFTWRIAIHAHEPFDVAIGDGCLFSDEVWLSVSDMHSIVDLESGRRINPGASIVIDADVWIGRGVTVLKGARIGTGSVIGTGAIVAGEIPPASLAAGVPARVLRGGIGWRRELVAC